MTSRPMRIDTGRRRLMLGAAWGAALWTVPGLYAAELAATAAMTEGPFYPDKFPLDTDNDLVLVNDRLTPAVGEVTYLSGRILTAAGSPVRNACVEIWQVDANASYLHTQGRVAGQDANFQGYGRFLTNGRGEYFFRTVKPVPYRLGDIFRTPHIHFAVSRNGRRLFTTQVHVRGHRDNERDLLLTRLDPALRETVLADFKPIEGSKLGELECRYDLVLGKTAVEHEDGPLKGGLGRPAGGRG